eukprot:gene18610-25124_t
MATVKSGEAMLRELLLGQPVDVDEAKSEREGLQLFKLAKAVTFSCSDRGKSITSKSVVVDLRKRCLLSNGAYGQRLAEMELGKSIVP